MRRPALFVFIFCVLSGFALFRLEAAASRRTALGIDVDFYTGHITKQAWLKMKDSGIRFVVAQAWGGRSRNEFAVSQLAMARSIGRMKEAAYILLNYDNKVCSTFDSPVRDGNGRCVGDLVAQQEPGARWQIRQGLLAAGSEIKNLAFVAIDVEWFARANVPATAPDFNRRRQAILDGIDELKRWHKKAVIYTRNAEGHWLQITGCNIPSPATDCKAFHDAVNDPSSPVPLWDVQTGEPNLANFRPYGAWTKRSGRQYKLDANLFGLQLNRTIDLNVFDVGLFSME